MADKGREYTSRGKILRRTKLYSYSHTKEKKKKKKKNATAFQF